MMQFEKNQVYDFTVKRVEFFGGEPYFVLSYEDRETMPGYEEYSWKFRTRVLGYQQEDADQYVGRKIQCKVQGFVKDYRNGGYESTFPNLMQDMNYLLRQEYIEGEDYDFEIVKIPGDLDENGKKLEGYKIQDKLENTHYLGTCGLSYSRNQVVRLRVSEIIGKNLKFESPHILEFKRYYKVGKQYTFVIITKNKKKGSRDEYYYAVREKAGKPGTHHFYFMDRNEEADDEIVLRLKSFSEKGWLVLEDPNESLSAAEMARVTLLEDEDIPRDEGMTLEYKKSFVYTPDTSRLDIDQQLGYNLMRVVAAFMNSKGGELCIGYNDAGQICGINDDIQFINTSKIVRNDYKKTLDHIRLLIGDFIKAKLGVLNMQYAETKFYKDSDNKLVCIIQVSRANDPVWYEEERFFIRTQNSIQQIKGDKVTTHIRNWYKADQSRVSDAENGNASDVEEMSKPAGRHTSEEMQPLDDNFDLSSLPPARTSQPSITQSQKPWQYITLYADGSASKHYKKSDAADVFMSIPVGAEYKGASARLLLCYDNGHVNSVVPKTIIDNKLKDRGKRYMNGFNTSEGVKLLRALVCDKEDYLVIFSRRANGMEMLKAVKVDKYCCSSIRKRVSMKSKGILVVRPELAETYDMMIVPEADKAYISEIITNASDKYGSGHAANSELCREAMRYLNQRRSLEASLARLNKGQDAEAEVDKSA